MAAPSSTIRVQSTGLYLRDGYQSLITFAADSDCGLWEVGVTPPGVDGGSPIDITTMHSTGRRRKQLRRLLEDTEGAMRCAFDPLFYTQLLSLINVNTVVTVWLPDGSNHAYWGGMTKFIPAEMIEGDMPLADVNWVVTNMDDSYAYQAPVFTDVTGT